MELLDRRPAGDKRISRHPRGVGDSASTTFDLLKTTRILAFSPPEPAPSANRRQVDAAQSERQKLIAAGQSKPSSFKGNLTDKQFYGMVGVGLLFVFNIIIGSRLPDPPPRPVAVAAPVKSQWERDLDKHVAEVWEGIHRDMPRQAREKYESEKRVDDARKQVERIERMIERDRFEGRAPLR